MTWTTWSTSRLLPFPSSGNDFSSGALPPPPPPPKEFAQTQCHEASAVWTPVEHSQISGAGGAFGNTDPGGKRSLALATLGHKRPEETSGSCERWDQHCALTLLTGCLGGLSEQQGNKMLPLAVKLTELTTVSEGCLATKGS